MDDLINGFGINLSTLGMRIFEWIITSGLRIVLIVIATFILLKISRMLSTKLFALLQRQRDDVEFAKRTETLKSVVRYIISISILVIAGLVLMGELGIEIGPILAAAGVLGLAIGFGAQSLVKDIISGFFILLEDQIRVGDVVSIVDKAGLVEKINLRMTILRDVEGKVHYIPNGSINVVTNMTKDFSCAVFEIGVAYRENVDQVIGIIRDLAEDLRSDPAFSDQILDPMEIFGLDKFADSAVVIKTRFKTAPGRQWAIEREFNRRLKKTFDEANIEITFPHMTLYMGKDKNNQSPPLNVLVESKN